MNSIEPLHEIIKLVDEGFTVTWLKVDGQYLAMAQRDGAAFVGVGGKPDDAWTMLHKHMGEAGVI